MLHIVTDSNCDLPREELERYGIRVLPMSIAFGVEVFTDDGRSIDREIFYARLGRPPFPRTDPPGPDAIRRLYLELAQDGERILSIHISSRLSRTFDLASAAAGELKGRADVQVIDTRTGSLALGFLVRRAAVLAEAGASREQIASVLQNLIPQSNFIFTVNSLEHLARGGRLSKAAALAGNAVALKPLIGVTPEGTMVPIDRAHGWRRAKDALMQWVESHITYAHENAMGVMHTRLPGEAAALAEILTSKFAPRAVVVNECGPSIGTHIGPGGLGITFYSEHGRLREGLS